MRISVARNYEIGYGQHLHLFLEREGGMIVLIPRVGKGLESVPGIQVRGTEALVESQARLQNHRDISVDLGTDKVRFVERLAGFKDRLFQS